MAEMIEFVFRGDASDLASALKDVTGGLDDVGRKADDVGEKSEQGFNRTIKVSKGAKVAIGAVSGAFVAAGAAAVKMARDTLKLADRLNRIAKEAKEAGTTAEEFQKLEGALGLLTKGGVSAAQTARFLGKNLADARDGAGPAADALAKLGLEADTLARLPLTERLAAIGDAMPQLRDQSERAQVAVDLLGRSGAALLPAFEEGGDAVRVAAEQIEEAGILSNGAALQAERLADAGDLAGRAFQNLKDSSLAPLMPVMEGFFVALSDTFVALQKAGIGGQQFGRLMMEVVGPAIVTGVGEAVKALKGLNATMALIRRGWAELKFIFAESGSDEMMQAFDERERAARDLDNAVKDFIATGDAVETWGQTFLETARRIRDESNAAAMAVDGLTRSTRSAAGAGAGAGAGPANDSGSSDLGEEGDFDADGQLTELEARDEMQGHLDRVGEDGGDTDLLDPELFRSEIDLANEAMVEFFENNYTAIESIKTAAMAVGGAIVDITRAAADAEIQQTERGTEARKKAVLKAFRMNKAAALLNAGINTALAVTNAAATQPFIPLGIVAMAAAAAAGAVQIGIIAAKQPPQFHRGGVLSQGAADEITVRARAGEGFLSNQGVAAAGGAEGVARLNRGGRSGPDAVYVVNRVGSRMIDVQTTNAIRRTDSPLSSAIRSARPRSVGRYDPFAKV
jgi:hypothetical protein